MSSSAIQQIRDQVQKELNGSVTIVGKLIHLIHIREGIAKNRRRVFFYLYVCKCVYVYMFVYMYHTLYMYMAIYNKKRHLCVGKKINK